MREIKFNFREWLKVKEMASHPDGPWAWLKQLTQQLFSRVTPLNQALAKVSPGDPISRSLQGAMSNWERYLKMGNNDDAQFQAYSSMMDFQQQIATAIQAAHPVVGQELMNWWRIIEDKLHQAFGHQSSQQPKMKAAPPVQKPVGIPPVIDKKNDSMFGRIFRRTA